MDQHLYKISGYPQCVFLDQEPWTDDTFKNISVRKSLLNAKTGIPEHLDIDLTHPTNIRILANSEYSEFKKSICDWRKYIFDWYYFYHGFAALDWFRDYQYVEPKSFMPQDKVFICYNHLTTKNRAYRLHLVSNLLDRGTIDYGKVSLSLENSGVNWLKTITDRSVPLDNRARVHIYKTLKKISDPLIIDTIDVNGTFSAKINFDELTSVLWHVVTETIYFEPKLHLTEKIFKPIVTGRPFILVAAPGNLKYLKKYGFKTFDHWIDESYDDILDHYDRIEAITNEIDRLCALSPSELVDMYSEMKSILDYNRNHFYNRFREIIVDEMIDNFDHVLCQINNGREPGNHSRYHIRFELPPGQLEHTRKLLKS
jgi:hypothetical protein